MGTNTKIEWTDATWNPILGCSRVSEGCRNCYAETIAGRFGGGKETVYSGLTHIVNGRAVWTGQIKETKKLLEPLSWRTPKRVFVNSMSDLFYENVTDEMRDRIFAVMALTPKHTYQVLTKRPERMREYISDTTMRGFGLGQDVVTRIADHADNAPAELRKRWPLPNVWLGVSDEGDRHERIDILRATPAAVRFVSAEPLIVNPGAVNLDGIDWVICGGESGPGARPMHPDWARSLRDQCQAAGVPFFFKQWGEWEPFGHGCGGPVAVSHDGKGHYSAAWSGDVETRKIRGVINAGGDAGGGLCVRVGKKAAGALLDGREWRQFPEAR